jgi:anti-sigma28 factor (negative regulator of flagellin synthesis)
MNSTFLKITLILTLALLIDGTTSMAETDKANKAAPKKTGAEQETTLQSPEEKIQQLESQIREQQEKIEQLKKQLPAEDLEHPVEKALRESWNCCASRNIQVDNNLVRIYFGDMYDIIFFFDGDPSLSAHDDLSIFLKKAGLKTGTIEYYSAPEKKLFSISGSLDEAKTEKFF